MADVKVLFDDRASRGQLIIITGLIIAVTLVALTLLLNTAIYTENLASRGTDVGGENALVFQLTAEETIAGLMVSVNDQEYDSSDKVETNLSNGIDSFDQTRTERYSEVGSSVNLTNITLHEGSRLRQTNSSRNFTSDSFTNDWILASGANNVRRFTFSFHTVNDTSDPENGSFVVKINNDDWKLFIHNDSDPTIKVTNTTESDPVEICNPGVEFPLEINLTAATVNGEFCSDLQFTKSTNAPYDLEFGRGGDAVGTYNVTINGSSSGNFNSVGGDSPYEFPVVYSTYFDVKFETEEVTYWSNVRVAPGEPDE